MEFTEANGLDVLSIQILACQSKLGNSRLITPIARLETSLFELRPTGPQGFGGQPSLSALFQAKVGGGGGSRTRG